MEFFLGMIAGIIFSLAVLPRFLTWLAHVLHRWLKKHGKI